MKLAKLLRNRLFLLTTALPTALATLYFGTIASDVFVSESRFVVRSPEHQTASPLGLMFKGAGFSKAQDDSYVVQDYILSRDALRSLNAKLDIKDRYASPGIDRLSRFAGVDLDESFEALHRHYLKHVNVTLDPSSSIITLTIRAYSAKDAVAINTHLLSIGERLVNRLNERGRNDLIAAAADDVREAQKKDSDASLELATYRNVQAVIDPEKQATIQLQLIAKLNDELLATQAQTLQLETLAKDSTQLPVLRQRAALLARQIDGETRRTAGAADSSLATKAAAYIRLAQKKEFTAKMLSSTMSSLEQARSEARRKQLYLELVASPSIPDVAVEPKRLRNICVTFVLGLLVFGILSMLLAGIREHRD